jgi:hypothetical protein
VNLSGWPKRPMLSVKLGKSAYVEGEFHSPFCFSLNIVSIFEVEIYCRLVNK